MLKIAVVGVGTVGTSVINILQENEKIITSRTGVKIVPTIGIVKNINKKRNVNIKLSQNIDDALNDDSIDVIVELIGGVDEAYNIVQKSLKHNKSVVTANKALLAYHRYDIQSLIKDNFFGFEASVAGGIPIIKALKEGLSANRIIDIKKID